MSQNKAIENVRKQMTPEEMEQRAEEQQQRYEEHSMWVFWNPEDNAIIFEEDEEEDEEHEEHDEYDEYDERRMENEAQLKEQLENQMDKAIENVRKQMTPEEMEQRAEEHQKGYLEQLLENEAQLLENEAQLKEQLENQMDEEIENHIKKVINGLWTFTRMPKIVEERYGGDEEKAIEEVFIPKLLGNKDIFGGNLNWYQWRQTDHYAFFAMYNACVFGVEPDEDESDEDLMMEFYEAFDEFVENAEVDEIMEILGFELPTLK